MFVSLIQSKHIMSNYNSTERNNNQYREAIMIIRQKNQM